MEIVRFWLPIATFLWLSGFFTSKLNADSNFIRVPIWLFYLCGAPKSENLSREKLTRGGTFMQIFAFLLLFLGIGSIFVFTDEKLGKLVVFWSSLVLSVLYTRYLASRHS